MIPVVSIPNFQSAVTSPAAVLYSGTSDAAIGRIPPQSVPATIAVAETQNQSRGNQQGRGGSSSGNAQQGISNPLAILNSAPATTGASSSPGVSSLFLAQLFGQGDTQDSSLLGSYLGSFSPTPSSTISYETMIAYSRVKYKPSNASVPQFESPAKQIADAPRSSASESRQMIARALQNQSVAPEAASVTSQTQRAATTSSSAGFAAVLSASQVKYAPSKPASGNPPSLIRAPHGTGSYQATAARNTLNLTQDVAPKVRVEL